MKTDTTIRNCPSGFKYQCPLKWENLKLTDSVNVRFCLSCNNNVYFCTSDKETIAHALEGHCIARMQPHISELPQMFIGIPDDQAPITKEQEEACNFRNKENSINDSIQNLKYSSRVCTNCGFPQEDWLKKCRICQTEIGRYNKTKD